MGCILGLPSTSIKYPPTFPMGRDEGGGIGG